MEDYYHAHIPTDQESQGNQPLPQYLCQHCDKSFTTQQSLSSHITWKHPEVKTPNQCHVCQEVFPYPSTLRYHLQQAHSEERLYSCPKCTFHCKSQCNLNQHLKIHEENRERFNCSICGNDYAWKSHLNRHLKSKHGSLHNEGNFESDSSQQNSETLFHEEHKQGEASGGIMESLIENIPVSVSQEVQKGLFTNEYHPTIEAGCIGSETTENEFPFAEWSCQCGNIYASQQDLHKHWHEDHKPSCSAAEAATRIVSGEFIQADSLSFTSAQHDYFSATNLTPGPSNGQFADWQHFR